MRTISIVGIDGSGKTYALRQVLDLLGRQWPRVQLLTCPAYHLTPNLPFAEVSEATDAFARASDTIACYQAKGTFSWYSMTFYGPIVSFLEDAYSPEVLISERHPIIDSIVYGPFYGDMMTSNVEEHLVRPALEAAVRADVEGTLDDVIAWHESESVRLDRPLSLWDMPLWIHEVFENTGAPLVEVLRRSYRAELPTDVILLDVSPEQSMARIAERDGGKAIELHENHKVLERLSRAYRDAMSLLAATYPETRVHVYNPDDDLIAFLKGVLTTA